MSGTLLGFIKIAFESPTEEEAEMRKTTKSFVNDIDVYIKRGIPGNEKATITPSV